MKALKFNPLDDYVVIEAQDEESVTPGGIHLPDAAKQKPLMGTVIATGPGRMLESGKRCEPQVAKGDTVAFGRFAGQKVETAGHEYLLMRESEIFAVVVQPGL